MDVQMQSSRNPEQDQTGDLERYNLEKDNKWDLYFHIYIEEMKHTYGHVDYRDAVTKYKVY